MKWLIKYIFNPVNTCYIAIKSIFYNFTKFQDKGALQIKKHIRIADFSS